MQTAPQFKTQGRTWEELLSRSINTPEDLPPDFPANREDLRKVLEKYPMRINPYYLRLLEGPGDGLWEQAVPDLRELTLTSGYVDPLGEEDRSPVPGLTHKYPDRVLFLVSGQCAMYCRFCNRKRKVGRPTMVTRESLREGLAYIRRTAKVRDVLLSGGDPLLLSDRTLFQLLEELKAISHVEIVRIGTRVPCTLPQRVTPELARMLRGFHPLYINTHFNHPREITPEAALACGRLADAGIPLACQTVLLRGINDDPGVMGALMRKLLTIRVRPYYLFQPDLARGTSHFWPPLKAGLEIMEALQGNTSGMCIPHFVIDLPEGKGKIPLLPPYVVEEQADRLVVKNYLGERITYPLLENGEAVPR